MLLEPHTTGVFQTPGPAHWLPGWSHVRAYRDPLSFLIQTAEHYPDIAHVRLGSRRDYILNHPDYIREALLGTEEQLLRGFNPILRRVMGNGLLSSQGEFHRVQRQSMQPLFHRQQVAVFSETMVRHSLEACDRWREGVIQDMAAEMLQLSFTIIVDILFGAQAETAHALCRVVDEAIQMTGRKGYLRRFMASRTPFFGEDELERTVRHLDEIVYALIRRQRESGESSPTMLSLLLDMANAADGSPGGSDKQVRDEAVTLLFAGHETIANALTWTWYLLSQHPEEERKFHQELDEVLGPRPLAIDDVPRLTYTSAILHEAMRLYPPVWLVVRRPSRDCMIGQYMVPAKSYLYLSPYSVHRDARFFPNPARFDPTRFTPAQVASRPKFAYFPFGGGGRKCIGEYFAIAEGILVLATIGQKWKARLVKNHPVEPAPLVTLRPKYGMLMTLNSRRPEQTAVTR